MNNTGSIVPAILPLQTLCDQIFLIPGDSNGVVLLHRRYAAYPVVRILGGQGGTEAATASGGVVTATSSGAIAGVHRPPGHSRASASAVATAARGLHATWGHPCAASRPV